MCRGYLLSSRVMKFRYMQATPQRCGGVACRGQSRRIACILCVTSTVNSVRYRQESQDGFGRTATASKQRKRQPTQIELPPPMHTTEAQLWHSIMEHVSERGAFADSKHFVDCPVVRPWDVVDQDWQILVARGITTASLQEFLARNFGKPGSDLEEVYPPGWHEAMLTWLEDVREADMRELGVAVNGLWKTLCRQACPAVFAHPERHTLLPLPYPFIVPGDRFRECYNWDSYWIILGLLASDLTPAAEQLVRNMLAMVDTCGFVPNGARSYYTNRSQPPLLSAMVMAVWSATNDDRLAVEALPRLVKQHRYWVSGNKAVAVTAAGEDRAKNGEAEMQTERGEVFMLSRYHAELYEPRPESYREDLELATKAGLDERQAAALYCDIASAAESGWDFSSRWYVGGKSLAFTRTTQIIPADLNAWLYNMELAIAAIASHIGEVALQDEYEAAASARLRAINTLMWNAKDGCWHDLLLTQTVTACDTDKIVTILPGSTLHQTSSDHAIPPCQGLGAEKPAPTHSSVDGNLDRNGLTPPAPTHVYGVRQRHGVYASNWVPLWSCCADPGSTQAAAAVAGLQASGLLQEGGLLTSLYRTGQQWDAPNAWPPLVHMAIDGMASVEVPEGRAAASELADRWLKANLKAWQATGHMHEKLDAYAPGGVGGGGEYEPQVGFGWSNGVLLTLMKRYCTGRV